MLIGGNYFSSTETVSAMAFGRLGQEDHVLVLITIGIYLFVFNYS